MSRPRPPYLSYERNRLGTPVWYVRVGGKRVRIREAYGTPEFDSAHQAALTQARQPQPATGATAGSLQWLIDQYRDTSAWQNLSKATRRQRDNIFKGIITAAGNQPYAKITKAAIESGRERRSSTPHQARHFLDTMRGLFRWAYRAQHIKHDPTAGVESPTRGKTEGFKPWTEEDVSAYEKRWPVGTPQRVWLDVLLYTGLRRGDAATGPCGDLTFIVGVKGRPLTKESFGNAFAEAARLAGVKKSCHGLRKIAATRCAENDGTLPQMNAIFGWSGSRMALHYIEAANRKKMAADAMAKLERGA